MVTYLDKKYKDFLKWSHCNGRPVDVKNKNIFQSGLIVMGDLPRWKMQRFFKMISLYVQVKNANIFQNGFIVMGDLPR